MAEGILGLGQGQAGALNSDLIERLKAVDRKATVEPIEKKLEKFESEKKVISDVTTKVNELYDAVKVFSLNQSTGTNAFQQKSANVSGDGVVFDSDDLSALKTGSLRVEVKELAQKDVWQSNPISGSKTDTVNAGIITINGTNIDTSKMSYTKLTEEINKISGVQASLVDSSDGKFRLAIKSTETGTANKINFDSSSGKISDGAAKLFGNIAQKDEWQTAINVSKDQFVNAGIITINGKEIDTANKDYETLINEINNTADIGVKASLVDSSDGKFRLSIQSTETGADKKIDFKVSGGSISAGALALFGNNDKSALDNSLNVVEAKDNTIDGANNVLTAQDMQLKADGVDYSSSSNTVTIDGLKITATKETGDSTINIENDTTTLSAQMKNFADKFNELRATIENEIYSADASVDDKDALRNMLETVKSVLFGSGNSGDNSIFGYGFTFDEKNGNLNFNPKDFESAIKDGTKDLEALFAGVDEKKGIGTILDETISVSGITKSLIDYELNMLSREDALNKEKEVAEASLDSKYSIMSQQFAAYGIMINQMEASFSGLKMMIQQSMVSK
ncbi:flagellar filament capping protein FliD [Aliarcobacter cryaerophilus]|uniref:Flagellar hook-associated protein 2 n=2 Tax=unclassified Arcobacter TaxID=2593671 RepID=A0AA96CM06_9BACT|nr:flagellar filament capping protein FliD [Arcobacter sp. AZ-2023]WPD10808.1 flagellar filament capping protein FliD [Arcobacter sp. DSM 115954]WNL15639.1 flagellar filament capping protein FliD [Arcobacter sp. AZ-2023]WNL18480.1 flagellar filament capping protein FliD [Arcobacter sp. AZ-2023]WNL20615.1 flagellar filament capping protein FliD [Arcobacter sp. AZ-2023]